MNTFDFDRIPEHLRQTCGDCAGSKLVMLNEEEVPCETCSGRGWVPPPYDDLMDLYFDLTDQFGPTKRTYHGWILKLARDPGFNQAYRTTYYELVDNKPVKVSGEVTYDVIECIHFFEVRLGKHIDIEENLGALGAFRVYTEDEQ